MGQVEEMWARWAIGAGILLLAVCVLWEPMGLERVPSAVWRIGMVAGVAIFVVRLLQAGIASGSTE